MFEGVRKALFVSALKRSLKKRAPAQFTYGPDIDYFVPTIRFADGRPDLLVDSYEGQKIIGREWNGERFDRSTDRPVEELIAGTLEITHFYGWLKIKSAGPLDFWFSQLTALAHRQKINEWFTQAQFNARTRFRHDRIELLKKLVEDHVSRSANAGLLAFLDKEYVSQIALFERVYGRRAFVHPDYDLESARFGLLLQALAASGDLEVKGKYEFRLAANALNTIAAYEQAERMHEDSVRHNRRILWLTILLAVATATQAYVAFAES